MTVIDVPRPVSPDRPRLSVIAVTDSPDECTVCTHYASEHETGGKCTAVVLSMTTLERRTCTCVAYAPQEMTCAKS